MRQLLLFEEGLHRHEAMIGRADARRRAAAEISQVFDAVTLQAAVGTGDALLPSYLAQVLGWVARRNDWPTRRQRFVGEARDAHLAEAQLRSATGGGKRGE